MATKKVKTPWFGNTGGIPTHVEYPTNSLYGAFKDAANKFPKYIATEYLKSKLTYKKLLKKVDIVAASLLKLGVKENEIVLVATPNCPQAVYLLYAINKIGAIASFIHPLSAEKEFEFYIKDTNARFIFTLDQFVTKILAIKDRTKLERIITSSVVSETNPLIKFFFKFTKEGKEEPHYKNSKDILNWKSFLKGNKKYRKDEVVDKDIKDKDALVLYSGGTTGTNKGIVLSNYNFNALGVQIITTNPMFKPGDIMLAAMPVFHGYGLGVSIHSMLISGGRSVLVPRFNPQSYGKMIYETKCNFIAAVPTLYEAIMRLNNLEGKDFSNLKGVYSGGDKLSLELKKRIDDFLHAHGAKIDVREGYGATETVNACCLTPIHKSKPGSIGVPLPDTYFKVVEPGTDKELPFNTVGELLVAGATTMKRYLNNDEETKLTLRTHDDGLTWVYTGDLGMMDEEGFIYFTGRAKRMIITSGYNVYPNQLEQIIDKCDVVDASCVIGVKDPLRVEKVKAYIVLKPGVEKIPLTKRKIMDYCSSNIAKYAMPREIEFIDALPKTKLGKVDYRLLQEESNKKAEKRNARMKQ